MRGGNRVRYRKGDDVRQRQLTPDSVLEVVREAFGGRIGFDPCTEADNPTKAESFVSLPDDGLSVRWKDRTFCNPPYGKAREPWVLKCIENLGRTILLIPAHTDTQSTQRALLASTEVVFIRARLPFGLVRQNGRTETASHGSLLIAFGCSLKPAEKLGVRMEVIR